MNEYYRSEDERWCYFHPRELVIGICALCLKEKLLVLAAASKHPHNLHQSHNNYTPKKFLPKIFSLTSLINPLDIKHHKSADHELYDDSHSSTSQEDNGVASWDKACKISKTSNSTNEHHQISDDHHEMPWDDDHHNHDDNGNNNNKIKSVVEHAKPRPALRWRKRIGHIIQLIRWKRSSTSRGNMCHVGTKLEGAKVKHGWIRILTKKRTKE